MGGVGVAADADGQGGSHTVGALDLADLLQDGELFPLEIGQLSGLHVEEEVVTVEPEDHALGRLQPVGKDVVDLGADGGAVALVQTLAQVLVVVHLDDGQDGTGGIESLGGVGIVGDIHPVGGGQELCIGASVTDVDQIAEDQELLVSNGHRFCTGVVSVQKPLDLEVGHQGGELGLKEMLPVSGQVEEPFVAPDDIVGVRPEDDDGQRRGDHGPPGGRVHAVGHLVQIGQDLVFPPGGAGMKVEIDHQDQDQFCQGQPDVEQGGETGKGQTDDEEGPEADFGEMDECFMEGLRTHESTPNQIGDEK